MCSGGLAWARPEQLGIELLLLCLEDETHWRRLGAVLCFREQHMETAACLVWSS